MMWKWLVMVFVMLLLLAVLTFEAITIVPTGPRFYVRGIVISIVLCLVIAIFAIFMKRLSKKVRRILWGFFLVILLSPSALYFLPNTYEDYHFPRVSEQDFDLTEYYLTNEHNKLATLEGPAMLTFRAEEPLPKLDGATALYPLYAAFAKATYPKEHRNAVEYHSTIGGFTALVEKEVDMVFIAHPSDWQLQQAERAGVQLVLTPIAKEAFVFFVNARNSINSLTVAQLQDIYGERVNNRNEIGGKDGKIIPFQRNENSGSQTAFVKFMAGNYIRKPQMEEVAGGMGFMINMVADYVNYRDAIGFSFRFFTNEMVGNKDIKLLNIDGVEPNVENIANGSYPLTSDFYAITLEDNTNPNVQVFLDWILSSQGQELVEKVGYVGVR